MGFKRTLSKIKLNYYNFLGYKIILPPQGSGDILFVCSLIKEYKKKFPNKKIIMWVTKKYFRDLVQIYANEIDGTILSKYLPSTKCKYDDLINKVYKFDDFYGLYKNNKLFKMAFVNAMNLSKNTELYFPRIKNVKDNSLSNTILIAPDAVTLPKIDDSFWLDIANKLKNKDYNVIFNTNDKSRFLNYEKVFWDVKTTIQKVNNMKAVILYRSGLSDVVGAFSRKTPQYVVYPSKIPSLKFSDEKYGAKLYFEFCSIKNNFNNELVHEFIYEENLIDILVSQIENNKSDNL